MKRKFFAFLLILMTASVSAQQHVSVPLNDPVYQVIENALIRNYIRPLPTAKPYSRAVILDALYEMIRSPQISAMEKSAAEGLIARFESRKTDPWYQRGGYRYDSEYAPDKTTENPSATEESDREEGSGSSATGTKKMGKRPALLKKKNLFIQQSKSADRGKAVPISELSITMLFFLPKTGSNSIYRVICPNIFLTAFRRLWGLLF